jgi:hypothetical protein
MDARTSRRPPTSHRCAGKRTGRGTSKTSPAFLKRATIGTCLLPRLKAAKLTFPMSLGPDGGLPRGPVESRTKHHYVCSGCLIDRLGSGLRHGRLHRLTMEKVSWRGAQPPPAAANLRAQIRTRGLAATDLEGRPTASDLTERTARREIIKDLNAGRSKRRTTPRSFMRTGARASLHLGRAETSEAG